MGDDHIFHYFSPWKLPFLGISRIVLGTVSAFGSFGRRPPATSAPGDVERKLLLLVGSLGEKHEAFVYNLYLL